MRVLRKENNITVLGFNLKSTERKLKQEISNILNSTTKIYYVITRGYNTIKIIEKDVNGISVNDGMFSLEWKGEDLMDLMLATYRVNIVLETPNGNFQVLKQEPLIILNPASTPTSTVSTSSTTETCKVTITLTSTDLYAGTVIIRDENDVSYRPDAQNMVLLPIGNYTMSGIGDKDGSYRKTFSIIKADMNTSKEISFGDDDFKASGGGTDFGGGMPGGFEDEDDGGMIEIP